MNAPCTTNRKAIKFPIYLSVFYLIATIIVYVLCPYDWITHKPILFYGLNFLYIAALFFGYLMGQIRPIRPFGKIHWTEEKTDRLAKIISVLVIVNVLMYLVYIFRSYGFKTPDFIGLFKEMAIGLKEPGLGYHLYNERLKVLDGPNVMGGTFYTLLALLWGFFKHAVSIFSVMYFKRLKLYGKIFTVVYFAMVLLFYMSIGTNIQVLHVFLMAELPVILEFFELWYHKKITKKKILRLLCFVLAGLAVVALYFGWMLESRSSTFGYNIEEYEIGGIAPGHGNSNEDSDEDPDKPMHPILQKINNLWISASSYLTQGYYGMSQALTLDWTPMFGLGNSMFVVDMVSDNITDIEQHTYQSKLEPLGWDSKIRWHSIYTWLANDVSFFGVPVVMFLIGYFFGMMFQDAITTKNPFARASIFFYILLLLFIPCNNQVGQSNENLCAFLLLIGLWLCCGRSPTPMAAEDPADKESVI